MKFLDPDDIYDIEVECPHRCGNHFSITGPRGLSLKEVCPSCQKKISITLEVLADCQKGEE